MKAKLLLISALATAVASVAGVAESSRAETIAVDGGLALKATDVATPSRGMTKDEVSSQFGAPVTKIPAVGNPPISRWNYPGFVVYFEHDHVIHSVVANS